MIAFGLGNFALITFTAMLGIMGVIGLTRLLAQKNVPVVSSVSKFIDMSWKAAA